MEIPAAIPQIQMGDLPEMEEGLLRPKRTVPPEADGFLMVLTAAWVGVILVVEELACLLVEAAV